MLTTQDLIDHLRQQIDELDTGGTIKDEHILAVLNRSRRQTASIIARRFDDMLESSYDFTTDGSATYNLPNDISERRIESVELTRNGVITTLDNIGTEASAIYRSTSSGNTTTPYFYKLEQSKIRIIPKSSGAAITIWYTRRPDLYVIPQGRITTIDTTNTYVKVDTLGPDVSTETDSLKAYLNIVDWRTGVIHKTLQTNAIDTTNKKITFKTSGLTRSSVLNQTIATAIGTDAAVDDYVCSVKGTCVPQLSDIFIDYEFQWSVVELKKRVGEPTQDDINTLLMAEKEIKRLALGRNLKASIRKTNSKWNPTLVNKRSYRV